jgi:hypothetical protein
MRILPMGFDAHEAVCVHGGLYHAENPAFIAYRMDVGETEKALRKTFDEARHATVRRRVILMEIGKQYAMRDPCGRCPAHILKQDGAEGD